MRNQSSKGMPRGQFAWAEHITWQRVANRSHLWSSMGKTVVTISINEPHENHKELRSTGV